MAEVKLAHGQVWTVKGRKGRQNIETLSEALAIQGDCGACGCEGTCFGYWTNINTTTGELMMMYIQNVDDVPTLIIEPYAEGLVNVKALKAVRDAE